MQLLHLQTSVHHAAKAHQKHSLPQFVEFAKAVCERLAALGHWADYIDPCR
jgi:hypothetical protein